MVIQIIAIVKLHLASHQPASVDCLNSLEWSTATFTHTFPLLASQTLHKKRTVSEGPVVRRVGADFLLCMALTPKHTGPFCLDLAAIERVTVHDSSYTLCIIF